MFELDKLLNALTKFFTQIYAERNEAGNFLRNDVADKLKNNDFFQTNLKN